MRVKDLRPDPEESRMRGKEFITGYWRCRNDAAEADARIERLENALENLIDVFPMPGCYDEQIALDKGRKVLKTEKE